MQNNNKELVLNCRTALDAYFTDFDYKQAKLKEALTSYPKADQISTALKQEMPLLLKDETALEVDVINGINQLGLTAATYNCIVQIV